MGVLPTELASAFKSQSKAYIECILQNHGVRLLHLNPFERRLCYRMKGHLTLNKVNQGDIIYMTGQHRALGRTATKPGTSKYFLPGENDRVRGSDA